MVDFRQPYPPTKVAPIGTLPGRTPSSEQFRPLEDQIGLLPNERGEQLLPKPAYRPIIPNPRGQFLPLQAGGSINPQPFQQRFTQALIPVPGVAGANFSDASRQNVWYQGKLYPTQEFWALFGRSGGNYQRSVPSLALSQLQSGGLNRGGGLQSILEALRILMGGGK